MKVVIRLSKRAELKALPILYRHSPGMVLPDRTYILEADAVRVLREAGVAFKVVCREGSPPQLAPGDVKL
jgi:hypothetical protein